MELILRGIFIFETIIGQIMTWCYHIFYRFKAGRKFVHKEQTKCIKSLLKRIYKNLVFGAMILGSNGNLAELGICAEMGFLKGTYQ